jgi:Icc-related predicted phosphoesterase
MKILAVTDQVIDRLYTAGVTSSFPNTDVLVGCGDLPYSYLEFLVSAFNIPLVYVPGNHDPVYKYNDPQTQAEGCLNLDLQTALIKGKLWAGFGGCLRYRPDGVNQYTQTEAFSRAFSLAPKLLWNRFRHGRALDILITHSPPHGIQDDDDPPHRGLRAINWLINFAQPKYVLHGHTIFYQQNLKLPETQVGHTKVINVYPYLAFEVA